MNGWPYALIKMTVLLPGLVLIPGLLGVVLSLRWRRLGMALIVAAFSGLWFFSIPWTANTLSRPLESAYPAVDSAELLNRGAEAIIVLGGGSYRKAPEYNGFDEVSSLALERLRYAARLHRATGLPLVATGGMPTGLTTPEGLMMQTNLEADFRVPVTWTEMRSTNTAENAAFTRVLVPYRKVAIVTHAVHMQRAMRVFETAGFEVIAAPMGFYSRPLPTYSLIHFLPDMKALSTSHYAIYERIGALWYACCYSAMRD